MLGLWMLSVCETEQGGGWREMERERVEGEKKGFVHRKGVQQKRVLGPLKQKL